MWPKELISKAEQIITAYTAAGKMIATAESCTGGMIGGLLTEISGSSAVVDRGFITYSNAAKMAMLDVRKASLDTDGAVSEQVAIAMAEGALKHSDADVTVAVTGVAGPTGGTDAKPVGTVWFGRAGAGLETYAERQVFEGLDRADVRLATVGRALTLVEEALG